LFARSGNVDNPDRNWSPWMPVDLGSGAEIPAPPARYLQWRAELRAGPTPPALESVLVYYLPKNVAPDFDEVTVQTGRHASTPSHNSAESSSNAAPATSRDRGTINVHWNVHDDNDDEMVYSIFYRGEGDDAWLLLADDLTERSYAFDASLLPDGAYKIKVLASDAPSHSPGEGLTAEKESERFEVDTTPPQVQNLTAVLHGQNVHVTFTASDSVSVIKRAEFSMDANDWQFIGPVGELSDSRSERYEFNTRVPPAGPVASHPSQLEHVMVVRVYDKFDNVSSAKTVVRPQPPAPGAR